MAHMLGPILVNACFSLAGDRKNLSRCLRGSVPGFDSEVSVLAIGDGLPTELEDGRERLFRQIVIDVIDGDAVDSDADGIAPVDGVDGTGCVDAYSLCGQRRGENQETNYACRLKKLR